MIFMLGLVKSRIIIAISDGRKDILKCGLQDPLRQEWRESLRLMMLKRNCVGIL